MQPSDGNESILIIAAHPDDEVFCYGTVSEMIKKGAEAHVLILSGGRNRSNPTYAAKAAGVIGIPSKNITMKHFDDQRFDMYERSWFADEISQVLSRVNPSIVFTHSGNDLNLDHRVVADATLVATRPYASNVKHVYAYEVPSSSEWNYPIKFSPNVFFEISDSIEQKVQSLECYVTEVRKTPHPRSAHGLRMMAEYHGMKTGMNRAEAFELVRSFNWL